MAANFINTSGNVIANSGNFTTLVVNGTSISNFNSSVSGLLPTIANSGDNRILTSTGSSVGINAEANLTFDGSTLGIIGNVGIGTSSPSAKLHISTTNNSNHLYVSGANQQGIQLRSSSNGDGILIGRGYFSNNQNDFFIYDLASNVPWIRIDTTGNVGIGTSSPSFKLDVSGAGRIGNGVSQGNPGSTDIKSTAHTLLSGTGGNYLAFGQYGSGSNYAQWIQSSFDNPSTATYNLVLQPLGGNVGIGTASGRVVSGYKFLTINDTIGSYVDLLSNGTRIGELGAEPGSMTLAAVGASIPLILRTNDQPRITISADGNVGIGAAPAALLDLGSTSGVKVFTYKSGGANAGVGTDLSGNAYEMSLFAGGTADTHGRISFGRRRVDTGTYTEFVAINSSGQLLVTAGSASACGVAFSGDTNTGLAQIGGADTASLVTAGAERVRVGSGGRVAFYANSEKFGVQLNKTSVADGPYIGSDGADIFTISAAGGAERVRVDANGSVGVGITAPTINTNGTVIHVHNSTASRAAIMHCTNAESGGAATNGLIVGKWSDNDNYFWEYGSKPIIFGTSGTEKMRIASDGVVTMNDVYEDTVGATNRDLFIDNTGKLGYVSSIRASKTGIAAINDVSWLRDLTPVSFHYRKRNEDGTYSDEPDGTLDYGLIAEDVESVAPELCFYDIVDDNPELRGVHYSKLITPMLKYIQQLEQELQNIKNRLSALEGE